MVLSRNDRVSKTVEERISSGLLQLKLYQPHFGDCSELSPNLCSYPGFPWHGHLHTLPFVSHKLSAVFFFPFSFCLHLLFLPEFIPLLSLPPSLCLPLFPKSSGPCCPPASTFSSHSSMLSCIQVLSEQ